MLLRGVSRAGRGWTKGRAMTIREYTDRSRIITAQDCLRRRHYEYEEGGLGIVSMKKPLPLVVGGSVHAGLASLLEDSKHAPHGAEHEDAAVAVALADFARWADALELDTTEQSAMTPVATTAELLAQSLSLAPDDPQVLAVMAQATARRSQFDQFLRDEQAALVEAMVRAYARRRLRPLLEQFEVLEVEREGQWLLGGGVICRDCGTRQSAHQREYDSDCHCGGGFHTTPEVWFMSRPDALLRERESNELFILSFKTAASWDIRKERDAAHDMQGLSEGVEVERRLGEWWDQLQRNGNYVEDGGKSEGFAMLKYLKGLSTPPRIHAIRYEYILKGDRRIDKDLTARYGMDVRAQQSHLISRYEAVSSPSKGKNADSFGTGDVCWSWNFTRIEDMRDSTLAWQNWKRRPAWEGPGGVRAWIDLLDAAAPFMSREDSTVGLDPRVLGWQSAAQKMGVTKDHPLDQVFLAPIIVYRNEDDLRDWVDSTEYQERMIAEHEAEIAACPDEGERRHLLNIYMPMSRVRCEYPSTCQYAKICYGGDDIRRAPLESGFYKIREPNHPQELGNK